MKENCIANLLNIIGTARRAAASSGTRAGTRGSIGRPTRTAQSLSFPTGLALPLLARAALPLASRLSFAAAPAAITPAGCFPRCRSAPHARTGFIRDPSFPAECSRRRTRALLSAFRPRGECRAQAHDSAASMPTPESSAAAPAGEGSAERRDGGAAEAADGAGSAQGEPFLCAQLLPLLLTWRMPMVTWSGTVRSYSGPASHVLEYADWLCIDPSLPHPSFQSSVPLPITSSRPPSQLSDPASHVNAVRRLSGPASHVMEYAKWVRSDQRFAGVPLQLSPSPMGHAFPRLRLRYKPALVQVGCPASTTLYLFLSTGTAVDLSCGPRLPAPPPALQAGARAGEWSWLHHTVPSVVQLSADLCAATPLSQDRHASHPPMFPAPHLSVAGGMEQLSADLCAATPLSPAEWRSKIDQMQRGEGEGGGEADRERRQGENNKGRGEEAVARTKKIMLLDVRNGGCFVLRHAGCAVRNVGIYATFILRFAFIRLSNSYLLSQATMASTPTATTSRTPPSESPGSSAGGTSSSTSLVCMDSKHAVYRHFKVPANSVGENGTKVCAYCNFTFVGGVHRCAQHITSWNGMRRREVHLCTAAPKTARDAVKALYESKLKAREAKRVAEIAAVGAVNGRGSDKKKSRMTDFYGDDAACANQAADEAISLFFAALHVPEHHADHPLWRNVVSSIQPSWRRDGVTVASDMFSDKAGRPQANVLLINDSGAVFVESIDTKMEMKTGGYIVGILRPIIEKVGPENVVALCFDGGSNYAAACRVLMREYPHIEHIPCATHVLDLLMEDIGKKGWAKDIVTRGDTLISFVRNHHFTWGYMRSPLVNGGKGKQVLKPAGTRFGTNYIAINRLCEVRAGLTEMVLSDEWVEWTAAADRAGADTFKDNILDAAWWTRAEFFAKLMRLPFVVMRKTDSDSKGMMGRLYDLMLQLTEDIRDFLDEHAEGVLTSDEVGDIREIVQDRWDNGLACNLHVIGRILYPTNQEECIFRTDLECTRVFKQYVSKHHGYEWDVGHFAGAVRPPVDNFRSTEFGLQEVRAGRQEVRAGRQEVRVGRQEMNVGRREGGKVVVEHTEATTAEQQQQLQQQQQQEEEEAGRQEEGAYDPLSEADKEETEVLMYCTGGIRCDVYSALLRQQGFKRLYTLEGGVARYMREQGGDHWNGRLFVFDSRLAVPPRDYQVGGKVLRAAEEEGVERVGEVLGEVLGGMMGAVEGEEEESVGCQRCGGRLEEVKHRNCANSDCNALILVYFACFQAFKSACSTNGAAAPCLLPFLACPSGCTLPCPLRPPLPTPLLSPCPYFPHGSLLRMFCSTCAQAMNGACSTECAAAPRLRPFLARPEPYQRLHTYLPTAPPPRLPGYVSRRALKRRARKARRLAAAEGGEGQGAGEGREEGQEMGRGQEVEVAA
ncbi:unnamed protein product [Closterium sp. NIES-64]|nr:unnamed protein product [Closterium sp. NIES-64]